jgi:NADPH-dependent 2,4-dienoyl-CoA reductase/sulfur reductase-like enzyme
MAIPPAAYIHLAEGIKKAVDIPVIGVGRINDPILANQIIKDGKADLAAMGRALLADPDLPNKAFRGELDDIRPCIYCNRCEMATSDNIHIKCTVNPNLGNENDYRTEPTPNPKRILVIGGGVAGIIAALTASKRGHIVELYERGHSLGGQLELSAIPPHKEEMTRLLNYLRTQISKSNVLVHLNTKATQKLIKENRADIIINATGAEPIKPKIPGIDRTNVIYSWDALKGADTKKEVIIVGGGMVGCETAEYLATLGKNVKIIEMLPDLGLDMEPFTKIFILERFSELGIKTYTSTLVTSIDEDGVETIDNKWKRQKIRGDTIVIAVGSAPHDTLFNELKTTGEKFNIGDSKKPSRILEAIHEATYISCKI